MAKYVLRTEDNKKAVIDPEEDTRLYSAPTMAGHTRGTDIYAHQAQSGTTYFYQHFWSRWQGEPDVFELISREKAEAMLIRLAGICGDNALNEVEIERAKEFGFDLMEETA